MLVRRWLRGRCLYDECLRCKLLTPVMRFGLSNRTKSLWSYESSILRIEFQGTKASVSSLGPWMDAFKPYPLTSNNVASMNLHSTGKARAWLLVEPLASTGGVPGAYRSIFTVDPSHSSGDCALDILAPLSVDGARIVRERGSNAASILARGRGA